MSGETQNNTWPLPKFYFMVSINGVDAPFQEVSGLETETQVIEYRHQNSKQFSTVKMPGIAKVGNVTLKKGVFTKENKFLEWFQNININTIERTIIIIKLLDELGNPTMKWTLQNAYPTKISGTDLSSDSNEVAVDTIEIAYESLVIANP